LADAAFNEPDPTSKTAITGPDTPATITEIIEIGSIGK
jgi:hypothetical protein